MNKKINVILLILSIVIFLCGSFTNRYIEVIIRGISLVINIYLLIISLIDKNKSNKVILILSILLTCFFGYATISGAFFNAKKTQYLNSEEFYIENAKSLERSLEDSAKYYYELEFYIENLGTNTFKITKNQAEQEFNEKWYNLTKEELGVCDGYTVINVNQQNLNKIIDDYKKEYNTDTYIPHIVASYGYDRIRESITIKSFISCNGDYSYTTDRYNK